MADGTAKPISGVRVGDKVLATDPATGKRSVRTVEAVLVHGDTALTDVTVKTDGREAVLHTTPHHPFWDKTKQRWINAGDLAPGDELRALDGRRTVVEAVDNFGGSQTMYDLTVDEVHTYYVLAGTTPVLVHNCGDAAKHSVDNLADSLDENTYFHYTDEAGHASIMEGGVVKANRKNVAYFTQDMVVPGDANGVLFAGNPGYAGRGSHVIAFRMPPGVLQRGTQANEVAHVGSSRFTPDQVIFHGPNPFK